MPVIPPSGTAAPEIEDGLYEAEWLDSEEKYVEADAFGKNHKLEIHLEVDLGNGKTETLDPLVNWAWSERATLYKFALGFGAVADLNSPFDTAMLDGKGKKAQVLIKTDHEKSAWPKVVDVIALKKSNGSAPSAPAEARAPWEGEAVDADTVSAWWKDILGQGFERVKVIALCKEMFEDRLPGELNADELKGLTDELNNRT